eukprot:3933533-Heterocapsa_arctica.AAC.1
MPSGRWRRRRRSRDGLPAHLGERGARWRGQGGSPYAEAWHGRTAGRDCRCTRGVRHGRVHAEFLRLASARNNMVLMTYGGGMCGEMCSECGQRGAGEAASDLYRASGPLMWRRWTPECQSTVACQVRVHGGGGASNGDVTGNPEG